MTKLWKIWPIGQAVKTLASHAGNSGSIPGWVTKQKTLGVSGCFFVSSAKWS